MCMCVPVYTKCLEGSSEVRKDIGCLELELQMSPGGGLGIELGSSEEDVSALITLCSPDL